MAGECNDCNDLNIIFLGLTVVYAWVFMVHIESKCNLHFLKRASRAFYLTVKTSEIEKIKIYFCFVAFCLS